MNSVQKSTLFSYLLMRLEELYLRDDREEKDGCMQRGWGQMTGEIDERTRKCAFDDLDSSSTKMQLHRILEAGMNISLPRKAKGCRSQAIADCVMIQIGCA